MRTVLIVLMSAASVCLHAQAPPTRWSAGVDFQVGPTRMPDRSAGVHISAVLVSSGTVRTLLDGSVYGPVGQDVGIVCVGPSNVPCDTRRVSQHGEITGTVLLGLPSGSASPWPFLLVRAGAYATRWGDGFLDGEPAHGAGPYGPLFAFGIGWHLPPSHLRLSVELDAKRYRGVRPSGDDRSAFSARISHSW
jgi:hypothetical protein